MKLLVDINLDNDAFSMPDVDVPTLNLSEVELALEFVTRGLNNGHNSGPIRDGNGNTIGTYEVVNDESPNPAKVCDDCGHEHGGAPHGFCKCGCTYPGWHWGIPKM